MSGHLCDQYCVAPWRQQELVEAEVEQCEYENPDDRAIHPSPRLRCNRLLQRHFVVAFEPSGVSSKTQLKINAGMKPTASRITMLRISHCGAPNSGNTVLDTCTMSQAPTRYSPAARMTLRRLSSTMSDMQQPRCRRSWSRHPSFGACQKDGVG